MGSILLIDDDRNLRGTLRELLEDLGHQISEAADGGEGLAMLESGPFDLVLCDWRMPQVSGLEVLKCLSLHESLPRIPVVVLTAFGDGESAADAMQEGAYDFLIKPVDVAQVRSTVQRALEHNALQKDMMRLEKERFRDERLVLHDDAITEQQLIGGSPAWIEVFKRIGQVARTDVSILLTGETGTGKEVVARTIHAKSDRRTGPLIAVNCAAIPAELVESELFGHERGSFTGAFAQKKGRFEAAQGGTLFLDEIGELPLALQPKLLRVLQERSFERVGGTQALKADVRVIAATNRNLGIEIEEKRFRADLYYRLAGYSLQLPPLRERRNDIIPLADYFLARFAQRNRTPLPALAPEAKELLLSYAFPGNIRELEQLIDRLAVSSSGRPITADILRSELREQNSRRDLSASTPLGLEDLPFHASVQAWESYLIERALRLSHGNKSEAARRLGIQRRLLYEKLGQQDKLTKDP